MAIIGNGAQSEFQAHGVQGAAGHRRSCGFMISTLGLRKMRRNLAGSGFHHHHAATPARRCEGRPDHHHLHRRQAVCDDPDRQHGRLRRPHQCRWRRLPRQDRAAQAISCCGPTSSSNIRRRPGSRARSSSCHEDFPVTELWQVIAGTAPGRTSRPVRSRCSTAWASPSRIFRRCAMCATGSPAPGLFEELDLLADPDEPGHVCHQPA
jgi:ornithine cyclodeaminase